MEEGKDIRKKVVRRGEEKKRMASYIDLLHFLTQDGESVSQGRLTEKVLPHFFVARPSPLNYTRRKNTKCQQTGFIRVA